MGCTAGVRVAKVAPLGSSSGKLQEDDVLLEIDGVEISQDGRTADASCCGTFRKLPARTVPPDRWLVPRMDGYDAAAEYTIVGGLVFIPLSRPWADLKCNEKQWNQARALMNQYVGQALSEEGRQVIILSKAAIQDYDEAISLDPQHAYAFYNRSFSKQKLGRIIECKAGTAIYGDLQKLDGLLEFLESGDEQVAHFEVAKPGKNAPRGELAVQIPPDGVRSVKVKYFLGGLPEDDTGENSLVSLLRPSVASKEKGKLLFKSFPPGQQHEESRLDLVDVPPDAWLVQAAMAEAEVVKAQQRVDEFLDDVRRRYEQGRISFYVRQEEKN
eukprot:s4452_g5.t1